MSQIITVTFAEGQREAIAAEPLEQWAYGQTLQFEGLELPQAYRVDFSNFEYCGASIPRVGGPDGVAVPVEVLTSGRNVYAFIWIQDETSGARYRRATVRVVPGPEPDTDESPEEQSAVTEAINALNNAVEAIPAEIQAAMEEAKQSGEYDGNRIWYSTIVPDKITSTISQLAFSQLSGVPDATPQIGDLVVAPEPAYYPTPAPITGTPTFLLVISDTPVGHQLARLKSVGSLRGIRGADGVSPSVSVSEITGGHQVSITDAQGTETFDVMDGPAGPSGGQFWTAQSAFTSPDYTWSFSNLIGPDDETPAVGDIIFYSIYRYTVASVDLQNQKVTCTARTSLRGPQGPAGQGVPVGGDQAQILSKKSGTDYDTQWSDLIALVPSTFKAALLQLAQKVAYIDDQGQTYYQDLYDALYPPKELVSISAVFTQGQTVVYDTDSLDNLKSMLVVTGTYDDQSTETIPSTGYTLSGTLTPGTSTITVTCDGKTTTFTVQVTHQPGVYAVTNNLSGCSNSNTAASVTEGSAYAARITASTGYTLVGAVVTITMGGQDITASAYSGGVISLASVTGALVISVAAVAVTLSSISAAYTQSGTVYNSDSLDSLKADLVVTATYSDSSTATVAAADYTLSGTLTVGTSTITASYGGKTATFTVTVTSDPVYEVYTIGTPSISGNVLTPGDSGMIRTNRVFSPGSSPWKIRAGFTTGTLSAYQDVIGSTDSSGASQRSALMEGAWYSDQGVYRIGAYLSGNGTNWNINQGTVVNELVSNTTYLVEIEFTGTQYTIRSSTDDGATWTPISTSGSWPSAINSTTAIKGGYYLGVGLKRNGYWQGTIDLAKVKVWVNGTLWWSPVLGA